METIIMHILMYIIILIVVILITSELFFRLIFKRTLGKKINGLAPKKLQPDFNIIKQLEDENIDWLNKTAKEQIWLETKQGNFNAYYLKKEVNPGKLVVLIHGYRGNKEQLNSVARYYYEKENIDVLMVELLGHGQSDGNYINFGYYDHHDIITLIHALKSERNYKILIHGFSMGALIALWVGSKYPVDKIIADSPYGKLRDNMVDTTPKLFTPFIRLFSLFTGIISKHRLGYSIKDITILDKVQNITTKTLLISGLNDKIVKSRHIKKIKDKMNIIPDLWFVENCPHLGAYVLEKEIYQSKIHDYLLDI